MSFFGHMADRICIFYPFVQSPSTGQSGHGAAQLDLQTFFFFFILTGSGAKVLSCISFYSLLDSIRAVLCRINFRLFFTVNKATNATPLPSLRLAVISLTLTQDCVSSLTADMVAWISNYKYSHIKITCSRGNTYKTGNRRIIACHDCQRYWNWSKTKRKNCWKKDCPVSYSQKGFQAEYKWQLETFLEIWSNLELDKHKT